MKFLIIISVCIAVSAAQSYSFGYQTADGQSRQESGHGGGVSGSYSYIDANGDTRQVRYTADANGFRPEGDISVDRKTAAAAAHLAALAPRAPVVPHGWAQPHWNSAPAVHWNSGPNHWAAPIIAPLVAPVPTWAVGPSWGGRSSYHVNTPTHRAWAQI